MAKKKVIQKPSTPRADYFRVQATMPKAMSDFLEGLGSRCKELDGFKLSKCEIIRSLIMSLQGVHRHLDLVEVKSEKELSKRITAAFKAAQGKRK